MPVFGNPCKSTLLTMAAGLLLCAPAQAVSVTNLAPREYRLGVSVTSGSEEVFLLAPGRTWRSASPAVTLRLPDGENPREIHARDQDEYAIWPDGELLIQRRRRTDGTAFQ